MLPIPATPHSSSFDPLAPSTPISYPLKTLQELESKSYFRSFHYPFNVSTVPLPEYATNLPDRSRLLVCHDMQGGYGDDRWVQGGSNPDAYSIWHWCFIDIFVYFSHHLVSLPPPSWINAAHTHGVKVLGTFIAEWAAGKAVCDVLLSTTHSVRMYAERLTELAVALGFDGWLLNMEVALNPRQIPNLIEFVSHLTQTMHTQKPGSLVIWYDSVTIYGGLNWQNRLNDLNKPFFESSDGIFVNYSWRPSYPELSASIAGQRKFDVYMGIDVFGRGTYGGGQWNVNSALDILKKSDVSAALFAPGWVYETKQPPDFQTAQNRWWGLIGRSWEIMRNYLMEMPFYSSFDQGHGYHFCISGEQVSNLSWNNMSCQTFQPFPDSLEPKSIQASLNPKEASFTRGGNITLYGDLQDMDQQYAVTLFEGKLLVDDSPLHFTYSVKSDGNSLVGLSLEFSGENKRKTVFLASGGSMLLTMNQFSSKFDQVIMPNKITELPDAGGWVIQEHGLSLGEHILTTIQAVCYKLKTREDETGETGSSRYYAVLGHLAIKSTKQIVRFPAAASWVVEGQFIKWEDGDQGSKCLSLKVMWTLNAKNDLLLRNYLIYNQKISNKADGSNKEAMEYLGVAAVEAYYVSQLLIPSGTSSVRFIIQVQGADGSTQKLEDCPSLQVDV